MTIPDGFTDDMNLELRSGTLEELVDFVIESELRQVDPASTMRELVARFGVSEVDAKLAWDRVMGGIVRAGTRNPLNCPNRNKDPIAWTSFQRGSKDLSIGTRLHRSPGEAPPSVLERASRWLVALTSKLGI